jgi:hypothetical protein
MILLEDLDHVTLLVAHHCLLGLHAVAPDQRAGFPAVPAREHE